MSVYESELNVDTYMPTVNGVAQECERQPERPVGFQHAQRPGIMPPVDRHSAESKPVSRRRRWTHDEKKSIVAETEGPGASISGVARKYGIAPRLLFSWRRQLSEEMALTTRSGAKIVPIGMVRDLEKRVKELEEQLAKKSTEVGTLTKALEMACGQDSKAMS